jgi:hypothetical protein
MKSTLAIFALIASAALSTPAQQMPRQDPLLDHMTGNWVLQGMINGRASTHDVQGSWVLGHQYVILHETSRENDAQGQPAYEAFILIGWDYLSSEYTCLLLDSGSSDGLAAKSIAHAKPNGDEIPFVFASAGNFHSTLTYNKGTDSWQWNLDSESGGKLSPFARLKLTRK